MAGSGLHDLCALSVIMLRQHDEENILRLAMASVASLGPCEIEAGYLVRDTVLVLAAGSPQPPRRALDNAVRALGGEDGPITGGGAWTFAFALRYAGVAIGYLVVRAASKPSLDVFQLLEVLARQTAAAMSNAVLLRTVSDLEWRREVDEGLTRIVATDGEDGIAEALFELTGYPVAVEDRFGNPRAWAGPDRPDPYPKAQPERRDELLAHAARHRGAIRNRDRVLVLIQPRSEILGVLSLIDPQRTAGPAELFVLERGAVMLALEFTHQRHVAEVELRLRGDLVDDLISGADEASAYARSEAVGHDLHGPHHVVVARWRQVDDQDLVRAVEHAATGLRLKILLGRRSRMAVLLVRNRPDVAALYHAIGTELGTPDGAVGMGRRCDSPAELPRAFGEAVQALDIRRISQSPSGTASYEELGLFRILNASENAPEIEQFVRDWLGTLIDYDLHRHTDLVPTLSSYLECGGNYDAAAATLTIHRSTLRYRLRRIREITGRDLTDADQRLNLHVATRAWKMLVGPP